MDKEGSDTLQELNNMQLKISYLFKELVREKNDYKQKSENLNKKLEQIYDETQNSKNEAETLKKQNESLRLINEDMKNVIDRGIKIFRTLDFSQENLIREHRIALENLKTIFLQYSTKIGNSKAIQEVMKEKKENNGIWQSDKEIEKKFEEFNSLNFCTEFFYDEEPNKNSLKKDIAVKKSNPDTILKTVSQNIYEGMKKPKESASVSENESFDSELSNKVSTNIIRLSQPSPELLQNESRLNKSPVFKDFGVRRHESISSEENSSASSTPLPTKLINEKFLERSNDFIVSPWKKSPRQGKEKSPLTPKGVKRQLKINSPERSPFLKKSNIREAEISFSGVRKLRQTFLNIECYKKKSLENRENKNFDIKDGDKANMEDDDIITESPKKADQVLEGIRNKKSGKELNDVPFITPSQASDADLDETYISSSLIRKCNLKKKHELERIIEDHMPLKRQAREKSPEYDSVAFVYKREPVRKKAERMKLPGHTCMECNKYYENAFEDIGTQDLKKILNKCSRHRNKNSPALDDTPPGYWKPFLTCSAAISPNKNEISKNSQY